MTPQEIQLIQQHAHTLFAPIGNLLNLLAGTKNFPIMHQIITLLSTVPLTRALWCLKRLQAFSQGSIDHNSIDYGVDFRLHDLVKDFFTEDEVLSQKLAGRKVRLVIGTIEEIFGPNISVKNFSRLLESDFLSSHGLELCEVNDALRMPEQALNSNLKQLDLDRLVLGSKPVQGLKYPVLMGKSSEPGLLVWRRRVTSGGCKDNEFIRLESCRLSEYTDRDYTKWVFIEKRLPTVI